MTYPAQPQQQFAPQPTWLAQPAQQVAPQQQQHIPAAALGAMSDPSSWTVGLAPESGGSPVKVAHLNGRTIAVVPLSEGSSPNPQNPAKPSKFVKCDVFVLDGPAPFYFGGSPNGKPTPIPDTMCVGQLPYLAEGTIMFGEVLHDRISPSIGKGILIGKVGTVLTKSGNTPWTLLPDDVTPEQTALVNQLIQAHYRDKTFINPQVQMIAGPQAQQQPQFAPQPSWPQAQPGVVAQPMQYAQPQPQFAAAPQPAMAAPFQPQPQFAPQAPAQQAPEVDWTLNQLPPGVGGEQLGQWQALPREQREQFLAHAGITRPTGL